MLGQMMQTALTISSLIMHADKYHGDTEVVARTHNGDIHRYTYTDVHRRARMLANGLSRLGVGPGDRVGSLAWNGHRHLELYFAVSGMGAVMHTTNPRLFPEQIAYIVNHAQDRQVFFDLSFSPLIDQLARQCVDVQTWVAMCDRSAMPQMSTSGVVCYEDLVNAETDDFDWPVLDENTASSLCYTSGTTGLPKGVLYSHRSTVLHAYAVALPDAFNLSAHDVALPVVPMFHVNAWGIPYSCAATGAKIVFPGSGLDGKNLFDLIEGEKVTVAAGVPTVWQGLLTYMNKNRLRFSTLRRTVIGGSACPPAMLQSIQEEYGVEVIHAWGMTELSPLGTVCTFKAKHANLGTEERLKLQSKQGRPVFGVDMKIVDGAGKELPRDGKAFGNLMVKGPWIVNRYFKDETTPLDAQGWFPTGDVATIDADGYMQITDRSKDLIKSGGEWISSITLENTAVGHPAVAEAAVIGVAHPKWDERPLLVVVRKPGAAVTRQELLKFFEGKVAKWWIPDDVAFVDQLPHTATGKLLKMKLREDFKAFQWPG